MTSTKMKLKFHLKKFLKTHSGLQFELLTLLDAWCFVGGFHLFIFSKSVTCGGLPRFKFLKFMSRFVVNDVLTYYRLENIIAIQRMKSG